MRHRGRFTKCLPTWIDSEFSNRFAVVSKNHSPIMILWQNFLGQLIFQGIDFCLLLHDLGL